jgi:phospholipid/cholesterol/gamma-HCH transport system substrate-binding protein
VLTQVEQSRLIENLDEISANAAVLSKNLKNISAYLANPEAAVTIQQLLDSARAAFINIQKLTSDIDEITGDPQLRQDLIRLIRGLTNLVSSTQQLQQEALYGQTLTQVAAEIATLVPVQPTPTVPNPPAKKP